MYYKINLNRCIYGKIKNRNMDNVNFGFQNIYKMFPLLIKITGVYFLWILFHYIASHLYVKLCVPETIIGFLISPFLITTPYCVGLRWVIQTGATTINNMWIIFGTWFCSQFFILDK
jgi:hypothetical protein